MQEGVMQEGVMQESVMQESAQGAELKFEETQLSLKALWKEELKTMPTKSEIQGQRERE